MTQEEKAKAYDEALERATKWYDGNTNEGFRGIFENIFPELAESEDERIRRAIIKSIEEDSSVYEQEVSKEQMLAWLEKQKEQKPEHFELKAGKWYICHRAFCCRADHLTVKEGERFMCEKDGVVKGFVIKEPEKYFKECSAPAPMEDEQKEQKPAECIEDSVKFEEGFKAGRESGLRDGQKYVLNNLDSYGLCKPAEWSEEDEKILNELLDYCNTENATWYNWLKSLRPPFKNREMKLKILKYLLTRCSSFEFEEVEDYLNNLRPSWKPSEEQMDALERCIDYMDESDNDDSGIMLTLYEQLKKLM